MFNNYLKVAFRVLLRKKFFTFVSLFAISFTLVVLMVVTAMSITSSGRCRRRTSAIAHSASITPKCRGLNPAPAAPRVLVSRPVCANLPQAEKVSICSIFSAATVYRNSEPVKVWLKYTDGAFWEILEFKFLEGGPFSAVDDQNGALMAVINEATRRKLFNDEPAVGKSLEIDGRRFQVVGVVANVPFLRLLPFADVWIPNGSAKIRSSELVGNHLGMILASDAGDIPAIKAEFQSRLSQVELDDPRIQSFCIARLRRFLNLPHAFSARQHGSLNPGFAHGTDHRGGPLYVTAGGQPN